ncbi:MAG: hypothetical protein EPN47_14280 [Acidobacteria bacterium]|nr:MAG: hypothetical protein EPN47_14280 [Acidobacteriota bacterium]
MKSTRIGLVMVGVVCFLGGTMIPSGRSAPPAPVEPQLMKYHIVNCMKVKPGKYQQAMQNEKDWKRIEQAYNAAGKRRGWALYGHQFPGSDDRCDYVTVDSFENWGDLEDPYPDLPNMFKKVYPDKNFDEFLQQTDDSHQIVHRDVSVLVDHVE